MWSRASNMSSRSMKSTLVCVARLGLLVCIVCSSGVYAEEGGRSQYPDGSGSYMGSDGVHRYASGVKCWNDYFLVESGRYNGPWKRALGEVYCTGTSQCQMQKMSGQQTCESWSVEVSAGVQNEFVTALVSAGYSHENCYAGADTTSCTWNDGQCHCIWTQQVMTYQHGYKRRRCTSENGDYTAWSEDVVHNAPTNAVNYGCGSKCTDQ